MIEKFAVGVAVDGSAASTAAVRWAAAEAARRGTPLKVIHVCEVNIAYLWAAPHLPEHLREQCRPTVAAGIELARRTAPGIEVTGWTLVGPACRMLLLASEYADLLVVGRTGRSALAAHLVGSTIYRLAAHARCPLVTVPAPLEDADRPAPVTDDAGPLAPRRIVVGTADHPNLGRAIDFALAEAAWHDAELVAVHACPGEPGSEPADRERERERLERLLASHRDGRPPIAGSTLVRTGSPAGVLTAVCRPDDLLVIGHRRHGPLVPAGIGRVAADCIHSARGPVAVVPEPAGTAEPARPRTSEPAGLVNS